VRTDPAPPALALVTYLARDYDETIAWFRAALGWELLEDTDLGDGKRWVRMAPPGAGTGFLIARATGAQVADIGRAAGGRVAFILTTADFAAAHARLRAAGAVFEEPPRHEPYGIVAVFRDLHGNRWDLLQPA
jgi:catechol 2,3-dioxygenase-like lactoylglutathione lyase family enzyme